jgi:Kef-type K+ transport system membrane component KefB
MVLATACIGKVLGTFIVAKVWGVENRKAIALGFLMNTKGLVELIVLNIGLSSGVRSLRPYSNCNSCHVPYSFQFVMAKTGTIKSSTNCCSTK